jgi:hypothetical protein
MKVKQVIILTVAVMALGALIGVLRAWLPSRTDDKQKSLNPQALTMETKASLVSEPITEGHYNFHFQNTHDVPITFGVLKRNCVCASVQVCIAPDDWKELIAAELAQRAEDPSLNWEPMELDGPGKSIPAGAAGWVRLNWRAGETGVKRYTAELWMQKPDRGAPLTLEVEATFVPPVIIREGQKLISDIYDVGKLDRGDSLKAAFMLFSQTRDKFELTPVPPREDPCIEYGKPTVLDKDMLEMLSSSQGLQGKPVKFGYRVEVTIHEHVGDRQLDLGAFRRTVAWTSPVAPERIEGRIRGIVLGEVSLANPGQYPGINLGTVHPERPVEHTATLDTDNLDVRLTWDEKKSLPYLDVKLVEGPDGKRQGQGHKYWTVSVKYKRDCGFLGQFPEPPRVEYRDCAVVFLVSHKGFSYAQALIGGLGKEPERRVRIPVKGTVQALER